MIGISIETFWQDDKAEGETCKNCKKEIKGVKWVLMLQVGDPLTSPAVPFNLIYCTLCKLAWDKSSNLE